MNLEGLESPFTWQYDQTSGFLHHLTYPNDMVRSNSYHPRLNLVTAIGYRKGADGELAAGHEYDYDALGRPTQRRDSWDAATPATIRDFTYNNAVNWSKIKSGRVGASTIGTITSATARLFGNWKRNSIMRPIASISTWT